MIPQKDIKGFDALVSLAIDMRWSWNHEADDIWRQLDPIQWETTHNPWVLLQTISNEQLQRQLASSAFRAQVSELLMSRQSADRAPAWFKTAHGSSPLTSVAYFSMEFMLSESLPIYVGGLGNVAGDQLKAASDLGVPVTGIGLLYQQGYFRQVIDADGEQKAYYPYNDPGQLPVKPLLNAQGDWLRLRLPFRGAPIWIRAWEVQVGRVKLYLLDSNDPANPPSYRGITSEIYGGDSEMRIQQEIVLGIGGWMLIEALNIRPDVCHLNEGHASFAILERAGSYMAQNGVGFEEALTVTRAGNLFTTHTAVAAGFDHFDPGLVTAYLGAYAADRLRLSQTDLLALGRQNGGDVNERFNMAYLAIHGSGAVNGVSKLHGLVSRHLFEPLFERWPTAEVPVGFVTNGVHTPSWDSAHADALWAQACGPDRWLGPTESLSTSILRIDDARLWEMRNACRHDLVDYVRVQTGQAHQFNPDTLTLGFARRFVAYKRPDLLLHDQDRLVRLLTNTQQPVQLVIAGKAPPTDEGGRGLIKRWIQFIRERGMSEHVVFLSDYDMLLAEHMVEGVDVWLNTPRRPWEASGTSGMKVLVNGGLNLSELDGWWVEAYSPAVGWALGDGNEHGDDPAWDAIEAEALYKILEEEVIPSFYHRNEQQIPTQWTEKMRQSMATLTPYFSANRTVRQYVESYYVPAATKYHERSDKQGAVGKAILQWRHALDQAWSKLWVEAPVSTFQAEAGGPGHNIINATVHLSGIDPQMVTVELFANGHDGADAPASRWEMHAASGAGGAASAGGAAPDGTLYTATIPADRPATDYTIRVMPRHPQVSLPLEDNRILWQR